MANKKTTGKACVKDYTCTLCESTYSASTNHYGPIYPWCNICKCQTVHRCETPIPEGWAAPPAWDVASLRNLLGILKGDK